MAANVSGGENYLGVNFDLSRVVPTGLENSPRTIAMRFWRRVA
jgi:hypothetical protein